MENELENINESFINNLDKKGGFKTPVDYFENSAKNILSIINITSTVSNLEPEVGFTVPENYFEESKNAILSKINKPQTKKISIYNNWKFVSGIAALLIATFSILFLLNNRDKSLEASLNKVSQEEMVDYLAKNDVKIEWINEANFKIESTINQEQNNKEIEQYLIEQADEQFLLDEL
jgi:aspartokinase